MAKDSVDVVYMLYRVIFVEALREWKQRKFINEEEDCGEVFL